MATHISARLAWHDSGWNGAVCKVPQCNTFCGGAHSYTGEKIAKNRDLAWEEQVKGKAFANLDRLPPCLFSANAFNPDESALSDAPPYFFQSGTLVEWEAPPYTLCVWPYEEMYRDEVKTDGKPDAKKRYERVKQFFDALEPGHSLVFPCANYSNPFSTENAKRYVLIGVGRISRVGDFQYYNDLSEEDRNKYGGFVWQKNISMDYPGQGFRIPYHRYLDKPEILDKLIVHPDNDRCFKYATRHMSDDDALSLIERFIEVAVFLRDDLHDDSENWTQRIEWLNSLVSELWKSRGLYPGFAATLETLGLTSGVSAFRKAVSSGGERSFKEQVECWLDDEKTPLPGWDIPVKTAREVRRQWQLREPLERHLLTEVLPRFDLDKDHYERILSDERDEWGITVSNAEIEENPFLLSESYSGTGPDDTISYSRIEHGLYPSPELGAEYRFPLDDWRRLRALCVDRLRRETRHTFIATSQLLQDINNRLALQPDWKRFLFREQYFKVDREALEKALVFRFEEGRTYAYLRTVYEAERTIEGQIRELAGRPEIQFTSPVTQQHWTGYLRKAGSPLMKGASSDYEDAIRSQATVCAQVFSKPVSVICGSAGTGKTTVVEAIIKAIEKAHGKGTPFCLLAPTGKAADRMRDKTGKEASTIHSFLAQRGWLRANLTVKARGGRCEEGITTFIIDEASMLDLELTAALLRAINWNSVQRLILVGDPNQLPPIGRGRVFADIIEWMRAENPETVGKLTVNLRHMENQVNGKGTAILELADVFIRERRMAGEKKDEAASLHAESMFKRLQDLPEDGSVDKDLRVLYWQDVEQLTHQLLERMIADMEEDSGISYDPERPWEIWSEAWKDEDGGTDPLYQQVLTPYRNEAYGTGAINLAIQQSARGGLIEKIGTAGGITIFDKVIQYRNRGRSEPIKAYNYNLRANEKVHVFNGELGIVMPHGFDRTNWKDKRLKRFTVRFARKEHLAVGYGKVDEYTEEKPEDNLELAYAVSVHKAQGSEFERVYFIIPKKAALLSPELLYTGLTRATRHCTLLVEKNVSPLLKMYRPESSHLEGINTSLFRFRAAPDEFADLRREGFLEEYRIHRALAEVMVRSKSEVIIANLLFDRNIPFFYEKPLHAPDGTFYLPDFTINFRGTWYYWEHLGMLENEEYKRRWEMKRAWYETHYPGRLLITEESGNLSIDAERLISGLGAAPDPRIRG